jgi:anti-sigma factor RsiW
MNCRRIEQLISLYVEGDLEPKKASEVSLHLSRCGSCSRMAADYRGSQDWLRASAQVDFGDAELDRLRAGVLKEIERQGVRPGFLQLMVRAFAAKRLALASAALLILFGALAVYLYSRAPGAGTGNAAKTGTDAPREDATATAVASSETRKPAPEADSVSPAPRKLYAGRKRLRRAPRVTSAPEQATTFRPEQADPIQPPGNQSQGGADSRGMLRIEIQTSDPNIRIIWFAPKESNSGLSRPTTDINQEALCLD